MTALPAPSAGLARRWRRLQWSLWRRLRPRRPVVVPFDRDLRIALRPMDRLAKAVYVDGCSDREHAALLHAVLRPGMTYFDVGAHIGQFTLMAGRLAGPGGAVHAFEASAEMFGLLTDNIRLNGLTCVRANHLAVCDERGQVRLNVCVPGKAEFNSLGKPLRPEEEVVGVETVPAVRLDDYCAEHDVRQVHLIKVDVNGPERAVVRGAKGLLSRPDGPALVLEFNDETTKPLGYRTADLRTELETLGYALFTFDAEQLAVAPEPPRAEYPETVNLVAIKDANTFCALLDEARRGAR